jgi:hypothetical protein
MIVAIFGNNYMDVEQGIPRDDIKSNGLETCVYG